MTTLLFSTLLAVAAVAAQTPAPRLNASMIVLGVSDLARSIAFYRDTLGLSAAPAPGDLPIFNAGPHQIVLNAAMSTQSAGVEIVFPVDSVTATRKQLEARGCAFDGPDREVAPQHWVATFHDPDGRRLSLFGPH